MTEILKPVPGTESLQKRETLLNEPRTGAQALMLLGKEFPKQGEKINLEKDHIKEFANEGILKEHREKINKASLNERDEFWKSTPKTERMVQWKSGMNAFLDIYKGNSSKTDEQTFLKNILKLDPQKSLDEVNADSIYNTFMKGDGMGDVEFFAKRIIETNTFDEIAKNKDLIKKLGNIYGKNSAEISELLTHGIANAKENLDLFVESAQKNLNEGNYGEEIIWTELDKNSKGGDDNKKEEDAKTSKEAAEKKAERVKNEIFTMAESKDKSQTEKLLDDVQEILKKEKKEGTGKLKDTIQQTSKEVKEYTREGDIVFIPESEGKLVVVTDLHGDLKTLKQVLEKSKFIENMETGDKSIQFVQTGDLVDRGPKQVEVLQLVMDLKRRYPKNVTIFGADHETYDGVSDHDFNDKIKEFYELSLDPKTELNDPVFGGFFKMFKELPKMAVAADGGVIVHGGPPATLWPYNLSTLANLSPNEAKWIAATATWGDPLDPSEVERSENQKKELTERLQVVLEKYKDEKDATKEIEFSEAEKEKAGIWQLNSLRQAYGILNSTPGFYPNDERIVSGSKIDACLGGLLHYSDKGIEQFLDGIGGKFMVRGHQTDKHFKSGLMASIHTTGMGSDESYYKNREPNPQYAVFPLNKQIDKIEDENIVPVWK
jgi:hypothetical protein